MIVVYETKPDYGLTKEVRTLLVFHENKVWVTHTYTGNKKYQSVKLDDECRLRWWSLRMKIMARYNAYDVVVNR